MWFLLAQVDWVQLLQTFGLAVVILLFIGYASWKSARWVGSEIIVPVRDTIMTRFAGFLNTIEGTVVKLDANVDTVTNNLGQQTQALKEIQGVNTKVQQTTERVAEALENEHSTMKTLISTAVSEGKSRHELLLAEVIKVQAEIKSVQADVKTLLERIK